MCDPVLTVPYKAKHEALGCVNVRAGSPSPLILTIYGYFSESLSVTSEEFTNGTSAVLTMSPSLTIYVCVCVCVCLTVQSDHCPCHATCPFPSNIISCVTDSSISLSLTVCLSLSVVFVAMSPVGGLQHLHRRPPDQPLTPPPNTPGNIRTKLCTHRIHTIYTHYTPKVYTEYTQITLTTVIKRNTTNGAQTDRLTNKLTIQSQSSFISVPHQLLQVLTGSYWFLLVLVCSSCF